MFTSIVSVLALAAAASAKTISIDVGNGGIIFTPNSTTADVGDLLEFHFFPETGPHSVVEGAFNTPCAPAASPFFSNFINGTSSGNETYIISVTSTDPIWYYCSAHKHCNFGMVGVVNPPSNLTIDAFAAAAKNASIVTPATTAISGTYTTFAATTTAAPSQGGNSSATTTGGGSTASGSGAGGASTTSSSKAGGAMKTAGVVGWMAAGGLAALII